jgi:hypothetical protein
MKHQTGRSRKLIILLIFAGTAFSANAQTTDSLHQSSKQLKNTIRVNVTSWLLYDNSFHLSYERVINKKQALNIFGGYNEFPLNLSLNLENTAFGQTKSRTGYAIGAEYRFYLAKENKHPIPRGVYLAPFISYYNFKSDRGITHTDSVGVKSTSNLYTRVGFLNIGGELGYQFVIGKRFVIDAVMFGPAITNYYFKARLDSKLPAIDNDEVLKEVLDALKEKFPLLNDITSEDGISSSGVQSFWSVGFRYNISLGFRF